MKSNRITLLGGNWIFIATSIFTKKKGGKTMKKKNWAMRIGSLAFVLTLVSTSLVSGTFSKYTTTVSGAEQVRVAKFAFNLKDGTGTFTETQTTEATYDIFTMADDTGVYNNGVNSSKFIAPGTTGDFNLTVENLSEVDVAATFALTETNANNIPVYYTYGADTQRYSAVLTGTYDGGAGTYKTLGDLATAMAAAGARIEATDGVTAATQAYKLNWYWAFESAGTQQTDDIDTALGKAYAAPPAVKLNVACTVTQLDT
jgi:hypothetical protein